MAVTSGDIKETYPLPVYNYKVDIDGETIAFSEVSGISISYETTTYKESPVDGGSPGPRVMHMPAPGSAPTITLKKGLVREKSINTFYNWINSISINQVDKKDISIHLCDETGAAVMTWNVLNAFPTSLNGPAFDANSSEVAIEELQVTADTIQMLAS